MNRTLPACGVPALCLLVTGLLVTGLLVTGCAAAGPSGAPAAASTTAPTTASAAPSSPTAATTAAPGTVMIQNFLFAPADITVAPGATITVVNQDTANHTVTARDHSFDTGNIPGNGSATFTAPSKPGVYPYICAIHPFMTGTLTVS